MGVYFPDMEIPNSCSECRVGDGYACYITGRIVQDEEWENGRAQFCPIDPDLTDMQPVVRAKWYLGDDMLLHCSNCDQTPHNRIIMNNVCIFDLTPIESLMKYCTRCGALMEGE